MMVRSVQKKVVACEETYLEIGPLVSGARSFSAG